MAKENIHKAMGSLAYAIAVADGTIQEKEKEVILELATKEFQLSDTDSEWINAIFTQLQEKNVGLNEAYTFAIDTLEANRHDYDFDEAMKNRCITFMKKIADAVGEIDHNETSVIDRFSADITRL